MLPTPQAVLGACTRFGQSGWPVPSRRRTENYVPEGEAVAARRDRQASRAFIIVQGDQLAVRGRIVPALPIGDGEPGRFVGPARRASGPRPDRHRRRAWRGSKRNLREGLIAACSTVLPSRNERSDPSPFLKSSWPGPCRFRARPSRSMMPKDGSAAPNKRPPSFSATSCTDRAVGHRDIVEAAATAVLPAPHDTWIPERSRREQVTAVHGPGHTREIAIDVADIRRDEDLKMRRGQNVDGGFIIVADGDPLAVRREGDGKGLLSRARRRLNERRLIASRRIKAHDAVKGGRDQPPGPIEIGSVRVGPVVPVARQSGVAAPRLVEPDAILACEGSHEVTAVRGIGEVVDDVGQSGQALLQAARDTVEQVDVFGLHRRCPAAESDRAAVRAERDCAELPYVAVADRHP